MWIWDKLTKAKVVRTDETLKITAISNLPLLFNLFIMFPIFIYVYTKYNTLRTTVLSPIILFISMILSDKYLDFNSGKLSVVNKRIEGILEQGKRGYKYNLEAPFFIDLLVKSKKQSIKIEIFNKNKLLGYFTLKNGEVLTKVIDGFTDLLDLELVENRKLSKGEVLSFKSKNSLLPAYSSIKVKEVPNMLILISETNESQWTEFYFQENRIRNYRKSIDFKKVDKLLIKSNNKGIGLKAVLNNRKKVDLFWQNTIEITANRDLNLLKQTLENRQELQNIEIELIEKS